MKEFLSASLPEIYGTSFHYGYVKATANQIAGVLGETDGYSDHKTQREWCCKVDGVVFTIYDYCEGRAIYPYEVIEYHIGTKSEADTRAIVEILKEHGLNAYISQ